MPIDITMPRLSDTMESGTVLKWTVSEGDAVSSGDVVADVETDKATMELTVFDDGTMAKIIVPEGTTVEVGARIAVMAEEGEDYADVAAGDGNGGAAKTPAADVPAIAAAGTPAAMAPGTTTPAATTPRAGATTDGGRIRATPVARRLADEHGIDLRRLNGRGPRGRITKRDVLDAVEATGETAAAVPPSAAAPAAPTPQVVEATPVPAIVTRGPAVGTGLAVGLEPGRRALSNMRQTIARRLVESTTTIPHYQVTMDFNMDPLLGLRKTLNEQLAPIGVKLSVNDFLVRACALAMHQHPEFNASWDVDGIIVHAEVNVGMAISMPAERGGGLVVGVIRHADQKSLRAISMESKFLAKKARERGLSIEEMSDSTFTLSNLGMFGVSDFTAIINPPNSAILAVGGAIERPVVRDHQLTVGHEMSATLSSDHRIIDGAMAAEYLQTLRGYLEMPGVLVV